MGEVNCMDEQKIKDVIELIKLLYEAFQELDPQQRRLLRDLQACGDNKKRLEAVLHRYGWTKPFEF